MFIWCVAMKVTAAILSVLIQTICLYIAAAQDTVTLLPVQPASGVSACPGQDVTINCTIVRVTNTQGVDPTVLTWVYKGDSIAATDLSPSSSVYYSAVFQTMDLTVTSTAVINSVLFSQHNSIIECFSPQTLRYSETIIIAGAVSPPSNLSIISKPPVSLTWLAPPNGPTDCVFNYTINITNYSSSSSYYSTNNTESLILTDDLITRGHNYSFAVAVTDRTGQHGPWSDQLTVIYDVPGMVSFIAQFHQSIINVTWQPPPLIAGFPVLHYVVFYNTSDNSTLIQVNSSMTSYTVSSVPEVTYYITVIAVNALGSGPISGYSTVIVPSFMPTTATQVSTTTQPVDNTVTVTMTTNQFIPTLTDTTQMSGEPTIIIAASVGGITVFICFLMVFIAIILYFVHSKGKKQKRLTHNSNTYSQSCEMNEKSIYADLTTPDNDECMPPPRPPPPVNKAAKRGELIYADLGTVPLHNKPAIPPPPMDKVIYSDAREYKPKKATKRGELIYADLGTVPLHNKPAIPPPPMDKVIYSDAREYKLKENPSNKEKKVMYADLGTAPGKRPMAAPLSTHDQVVYSTVNQN